MTSRRDFLSALAATALPAAAAAQQTGAAKPAQPNILFVYSDDISWCYHGAYGDRTARTPAFDRIAKEGVLFLHSYSAAPGCTPSRSAVLTGRPIYLTGEGGLLFGHLPKRLPVFPNLLEDAGYFCGFTGKTWSPGEYDGDGRTRHPVGKAYDARKISPPLPAINPLDYAANFADFLKDRPANQPFFFWFGATEAHRAFEKGAGQPSGVNPAEVHVPGFLPDTPEMREDIADYIREIEYHDQHLARMLTLLEQRNELDRTLIIVTSDNGMPFPRAKANLYDWGTRMPLAIRWPGRIPPGRVVEDFVSHTDLGPTVLEAAGLPAMTGATGRSLVPLLASSRQGLVDPRRTAAVTAHERHTWCRPNGAPYPMRALRTRDFLYIRNFEPDRWPAGDPDFESPHQGAWGDVDNGPAKTFLIEHRERFPKHFEWAFGKRPAEELYEVRRDPANIHNLAENPQFTNVLKQIRRDLDRELARTGDPRAKGESPWDRYPYYFGPFHPKTGGNK